MYKILAIIVGGSCLMVSLPGLHFAWFIPLLIGIYGFAGLTPEHRYGEKMEAAFAGQTRPELVTSLILASKKRVTGYLIFLFLISVLMWVMLYIYPPPPH